jgi:hypothetical protein
LENHYLYEWISVHLDWAEQKRVSLILSGINQFVDLAD